ncbi:hypothetical protein ACO1O0_000457 [Amphichorda felina]
MATHYSQKKHLFPMQGGCPCGATRYQLNLAPILVHCCHCTSCQRQVGSAFAINAIVESSAVALLPPAPTSIPTSTDDPTPSPCALLPAYARLCNAHPVDTAGEQQQGGGQPAEPDLITVPSSSSIGLTLAQCPRCHTVLWNHYADAGPLAVYLRVGTLDCPWEIDPDVHIYTSRRRRFVTIDDGKPQFDKYYDGTRAEQCREEVLPRLRALEGGDDMVKYRTELRSAIMALHEG